MRHTLRIFVARIVAVAMAFTFSGAPVLAHQSPADTPDVKVIISFNDIPGASEQALINRFGGTVTHSYHIVPAIAATVPESSLAGLSSNPLVKSIDLDGKVYKLDAELDNTWGVQRIGAGTVHANGNSGGTVKVAVIDSGVDYTHPDLSAHFAGGYDFVNNDADPMDDNGHGTHVAGTIAAMDDDVGVVGASPSAQIYALKVLDASGSGYWSDIIIAIQWTVDNGIQVANLSLGSASDPGDIVASAFDNAETAGVLVVAAAGNSGNRSGRGEKIGYPAVYESVIAVGATDKSDKRASFSSTGSELELMAPGVTINSTKLGGGYVGYSGTSMASPHVAGTAALVLAAGVVDTNGNGRVNDEVRQILGGTADDLGETGRDSKYGFGLVNAVAAVASVVPPTPLDPAVNIALSTDKSDYVSGTDTSATLTAIVTDENGDAISGLNAAAFATELDNLSATVTFSETATPGTYVGNLDIATLADGSYTTAVTVTDTRSLSGTGSATFTISPAPSEPTLAIVESITYVTEGGKNGDKHLSVTVAVVDDFGDPVAGATVSIDLLRDGSLVGRGSGTTGTNGTLTFTLKNAQSGCYETVVTQLSAGGLAWDGVTPANGFCK